DMEIARLTVLLDLQLFTDAEYEAIYEYPKGAHIITILVPVWCPVEVRQLNHSLLHETRHLIQNVVLQEKDHEAQNCLDWEDRPCEIDAEAFATQHEQQSIFLSAKVSPTICVKASLRDWWTRGATHLWRLET